jgi:hypothetical protein
MIWSCEISLKKKWNMYVLGKSLVRYCREKHKNQQNTNKSRVSNKNGTQNSYLQ